MLGRRILVGVTGGIAAFKTAELVSALVKEGAQVRVAMSRTARQFVGPATFEALSTQPVIGEHFAVPAGESAPAASFEDHIAIARWAELVVIAPATAHFVGRIAHGLADDFLTTCVLATRAPILVAPAMNTEMLEHPTVQANLERLRELGIQLLYGAPGRLACGTEGVGRMAEPAELFEAVRARFESSDTRDLAGRRILIAAGRTEEAIDPVRYLSNRSSGKTGVALAEEALSRGARVTLVWGPADVEPPAGLEIVPVVSAAEMERAMLRAFPGADATIMAAAVADYRPRTARAEKLRRVEGGTMALELEPTRDILGELSRHPARKDRVLIGFALETDGEPESARAKLERKGLDLLVWNDPTRSGAGFGGDENDVALLDAAGGIERLPRLAKREIARRIFDRVLPMLETRGATGAAGAARRPRRPAGSAQ